MDEARDDSAPSDSLVVTAERPVVPRWQVVFLAVVSVYLVVVLTDGSWQLSVVAALIIAGQLANIAARCRRVVVDPTGVTLRGVVRMDHLPWARIRRITLDWRWRRESFQLELDDEDRRSLQALAALGRDARSDERQRFLEVLRRSADRAEVEIVVHVPQRGEPLEP